MPPDLTVIIVSYNTRALLLDCLRSLFADTRINLEVIVVDNHSADGSAAAVAEHFPQVKLIRNRANLGFAKANNQGIQASRASYLLLLNSDTLVRPDALAHLLDFANANHIVGIASPQLVNQDGSIQPNGGSFPNLFNVWCWQFFLDDIPGIASLIRPYQRSRPGFFSATRELDWVSGTAMLIRKTVLEDVGLLDEAIFMYSEDTDLCLRAKKEYYQVFSVASAQVVHLSHRSGSREKAVLGEYQGLLYLWRKHRPAWQLPLLRALLYLGAKFRAFIFGRIIKDSAKSHIYEKAAAVVR